MGKRIYSSEVSGDVALVTTTETVVATVTGVTTAFAGETVRIEASASVTTGADTTALTFRVRRDSLTGTIVNNADPVQVEVAAGSTEDHGVQCEDTFTGEVAGQTYVLTVQQTAASANGSVLNSYMSVSVG